MSEQVIITDFTRMAGGHVCVAGYTHAGQAVRLSWPRVLERDLFKGGPPAAFPSAVVECDLIRTCPSRLTRRILATIPPRCALCAG